MGLIEELKKKRDQAVALARKVPASPVSTAIGVARKALPNTSFNNPGSVAMGVAKRVQPSKVWDQINPYDNGKTYNNPTPTGNRSVVSQWKDSQVSGIKGAPGFVRAVADPFVKLGKVGVEYNRAALAKGSGNTNAYNASRTRLDENLNGAFVLGGANRLVRNAVGSISGSRQDVLDQKLAESIAQNQITASNAMKRTRTPISLSNNYARSNQGDLSLIDYGARMRERGSSNLAGVAASAETGLDLGSLGLGSVGLGVLKPTASRLLGTGLQGGIGNLAGAYGQDPDFDIKNAGQVTKTFASGFGTGLVAGEGTRLLNNTVTKTPADTRLNDADVSDLLKIKNGRGDFMDDVEYTKALESVRKAGIDITKPEAWQQIDGVLARYNQVLEGRGDPSMFDMGQSRFKPTPLNQGGYIKNPLAKKNDSLKKIYHGTDKVFDEFDVEKSADGGVWFTDRKDLVEKGDVGASGKGQIMERFIDENDLKLANWDDVDKYTDDQLINMGYDGYKLSEDGENTYKIFDPKKTLKSDQATKNKLGLTPLNQGGYIRNLLANDAPPEIPSYVPKGREAEYLKSEDYLKDQRFNKMASETKSGDPFDHPDMYDNPTPDMYKNLKNPPAAPVAAPKPKVATNDAPQVGKTDINSKMLAEAKKRGYGDKYTQEGQIANTVDELMKEMNAVRDVGIPLLDKYKAKMDGKTSIEKLMTPAELKAYKQAQQTSDNASNLLKEYFDSKKSTPTPQVGKTPKAEVATPLAEPQVQRVAQTEALPPALRTDGTMVAQGGGMTNAPDSTVATSPKAKKTRYASQTVPESEFVSDQVKKSVKENAPTYEVQNERARYTDSLGRVKKQGIDNFTNDLTQRLEVKKGTIDAQTVADGQTAAAMLDAQGDPASLQKATDIYERLSEHLTAAGQTVQAASILSRRTPDGLQYGAIKTLKQAGVEITPQLQTQLKKLVGDVRVNPKDPMARHKVAEFVAKNTPSTFAGKATTIWKAGLLTSPTTTAGNVMANTAEQTWKRGYVDPVQTGVDILFSIFTGKRSKTLTGKGVVSGAKEGAIKGVSYYKTGFDPRNPEAKFDVHEIHFSDTPQGKVAEAYTQGVFRLMGAQDQPFYYASLRNSLYDQAITEAKNLNLKGAQRETYVKKFVTEPSEKAMQLADTEARYDVFQNKTAIGNIASGVKQGAKNAGQGADALSEVIIPFSQVPASVATRIVERTPIGTANEIIKQIKNKSFDQRRMTQAIANGSSAVVLAGVGFALADNDGITLGYPKDDTERKLWELEGKQPYSVKIGNKWVSMNYLQPAGTLIAAGAEYKKAKNEGASTTEAWSRAVAGAGKALTEQTFLKGVSGALNAVNDPTQYASKLIENTVGSVIPSIVGSVARSTDSAQRQINSVSDSLKSRVPGLRQTLMTKKDAFGEDLSRPSSTFNSFLNPGRPSDIKEGDATTKELRRLQDAQLGVMTPDIKRNTITGETLDPKQLDELNKTVKPEIKKAWDAIIADPRYQAMSDDQKQKVLSNASSDIFAARKAEYQAKNNLGYYNPKNTDLKQPKLDDKQKRLLNDGNVDYLGGSLPKGFENTDEPIQKFYGSYTSRDDETAKEWLTKPLEAEGEDLYRRVSQMRPDGMPELPKTNETAKLYADYKKEQANSKWSKLQETEKKKELLRTVYKTQLTDDQKFVDDLGTEKLIYAIDNGQVDPNIMKSMVELDNALIKLGGTAMLSKTVRNRYGLGSAPSSGGSGSGKAKKPVGLGSFTLLPQKSSIGSVANLLKNARVSYKS